MTKSKPFLALKILINKNRIYLDITKSVIQAISIKEKKKIKRN